MKRMIVIVTCLLLAVSAYPGAIVNNEGTSGEDSLVVSVLNWDSTGCSPIAADSFWVVVLKSGDNDVVFKDSGTTSMTGLDTIRIAGKTVYYFRRAVPDIVGESNYGQYTGELVAKHVSLGLFNTSNFSFQVVGWELDDLGDSAAFAAKVYDSLVTKCAITDSLYAVLDSIQEQAAWISSFDPSTEEVFLGVDEFAEMADTIFGRDSNLYDEGYWHKVANRSDSGSVAGGSDSASIAGWVWNTPQSNHIIDGTFGGYLDAEISGLGSGSGVYSQTIVAFDSTLEQVIPFVNMAVRNLDQTSLLAVGATGSDGHVSFNLDGGSYLVVASAAGYIFEANADLEVTGNSIDTVYGDQFDPGMPPSPNLCRVYGHLYDLSGAAEQGATVTASLPSGVVRFDGVIVSPSVMMATTDSEGYFCLDLIPTNLLTPAGTLYEFAINRSDGTILRQRVVVPESNDWRLSW